MILKSENEPAKRSAPSDADSHDEHYDFIVCGAGSSGCVVAARLMAPCVVIGEKAAEAIQANYKL